MELWENEELMSPSSGNCQEALWMVIQMSSCGSWLFTGWLCVLWPCRFYVNPWFGVATDLGSVRFLFFRGSFCGNGPLQPNWHSVACAPPHGPPNPHFVTTIALWKSAKRDIWQTGKWKRWTWAAQHPFSPHPPWPLLSSAMQTDTKGHAENQQVLVFGQ